MRDRGLVELGTDADQLLTQQKAARTKADVIVARARAHQHGLYATGGDLIRQEMAALHDAGHPGGVYVDGNEP